jgi:hypothetical protein
MPRLSGERAVVQNPLARYAREGRKAALQAVFKTMLHHLVTGKIRVKHL